MLILPAIDLMGGQVVRLRQGRAEEKTVYSDDPVAFARKWEEEGGDYLHLVDLDAAFLGESQNLEVVRKVAAAISIPCELGGGMRDRDSVARALEAGVSRVVIGTRASEAVEFVGAVAAEFGSERIAVGIDARDGWVAVKGWTEATRQRGLDLARQAEAMGAGTIIYTDIATDGMMQGPNFGEIEALLSQLKCQIIASGGITSCEDVERLRGMPNLYGAIIGKALYEGTIRLDEIKDGTSA